MKLSFKDVATTIVAIVVAVGLVAKLRSYDWAFIGSWKGAVGTLGILGFLMLLFDEADFLRFNSWGMFEGLFALVGAGLLVAGLLVASKLLFVLLAADILAFWLTSLARHGLSHEPTTQQGLFNRT